MVEIGLYVIFGVICDYYHGTRPGAVSGGGRGVSGGGRWVSGGGGQGIYHGTRLFSNKKCNKSVFISKKMLFI